MITQDYLKAALVYDRESGLFTWNDDRPQTHFRSQHGYLVWKGQYAGNSAGSVTHNGYIKISISKKEHLAHRLAWLYEHGVFPEQEIDHVNGNKTDNRISNLRAVSCKENHKNKPMTSRNNSGVVGVYWCKSAVKWIAQIRYNGKTKTLGAFHDKYDAIEARKLAEIAFGYHKNHGRLQTRGD